MQATLVINIITALIVEIQKTPDRASRGTGRSLLASRASVQFLGQVRANLKILRPAPLGNRQRATTVCGRTVKSGQMGRIAYLGTVVVTVTYDLLSDFFPAGLGIKHSPHTAAGINRATAAVAIAANAVAIGILRTNAGLLHVQAAGYLLGAQ